MIYVIQTSVLKSDFALWYWWSKKRFPIGSFRLMWSKRWHLLGWTHPVRFQFLAFCSHLEGSQLILVKDKRCRYLQNVSPKNIFCVIILSLVLMWPYFDSYLFFLPPSSFKSKFFVQVFFFVLGHFITSKFKKKLRRCATMWKDVRQCAKMCEDVQRCA